MCTKEVPHQLIPSLAECPVPRLHPLAGLSRRGVVGGVEGIRRHWETPTQQWVPNPYPLHHFTTTAPQHQWITLHLWMRATKQVDWRECVIPDPLCPKHIAASIIFQYGRCTTKSDYLYLLLPVWKCSKYWFKLELPRPYYVSQLNIVGSYRFSALWHNSGWKNPIPREAIFKSTIDSDFLGDSH